MSTIEEHVQWKPWKDGEFCLRDKASRSPNLFKSTNSLSGRLQTWRVNVSQRYKCFWKDVIGRQPKVRWIMSLTQLVALFVNMPTNLPPPFKRPCHGGELCTYSICIVLDTSVCRWNFKSKAKDILCFLITCTPLTK